MISLSGRGSTFPACGLLIAGESEHKGEKKGLRGGVL